MRRRRATDRRSKNLTTAFGAAASESNATADDDDRFELVRYDFVLDAGGAPWLLEVNSWPNMAPSSAGQAAQLARLCSWLRRLSGDTAPPPTTSESAVTGGSELQAGSEGHASSDVARKELRQVERSRARHEYNDRQPLRPVDAVEQPNQRNGMRGCRGTAGGAARGADSPAESSRHAAAPASQGARRHRRPAAGSRSVD